MAVGLFSNLNLNGCEIQNVKFQILATDPSTLSEAMFWYNSTDHKLKYYNGTTIIASDEFNINALTSVTPADGDFFAIYDLSGVSNAKVSGTNLKVYLKAYFDTVYGSGSGDMLKSVYDTNDSGVVDNSEKLGGQLPAYYAKDSDLDAHAGDTDIHVTTAEKNTWNDKQNALTFDNVPTEGSSNPVKSGGVFAELEDKVDKVTGKGLSTNDYTTNEKNKLAGITAGAEPNVNPDWNASSGGAQILNKPAIPAAISDLTDDTASTPVARAAGDGNGNNIANTYIPIAQKGAVNGVAPLGADQKISSSYLPSYVDDVIDLVTVCQSASSAPAVIDDGYYFNTTDSKLYKESSGAWVVYTPTSGDKFGCSTDSKIYTYGSSWVGVVAESGKIYVATDTSHIWRYSGSALVDITAGGATLHKYVGTIVGNGSTTSFVITHNLGTRDVVVNIYDATTNADILTDVVRTNITSITVSFAAAPTVGTNYKVVIVA